MKTLILCLAALFLLQTAISAQTTATWVGGTPGRPTDWTCSSNWNENRVPDENTQVILPSDRYYYPVITFESPEIDALLITGGAKLTISSGGSLSILGASGRLDGITIHGLIINNGQLNVEIREEKLAAMKNNIEGNGTCLIAGNIIYDDVAQK